MQTLYTGIVQSKIQAFISLVFVISWNKIKDKGKKLFRFCFASIPVLAGKATRFLFLMCRSCGEDSREIISRPN